jgi:hypothetical protein
MLLVSADSATAGVDVQCRREVELERVQRKAKGATVGFVSTIEVKRQHVASSGPGLANSPCAMPLRVLRLGCTCTGTSQVVCACGWERNIGHVACVCVLRVPPWPMCHVQMRMVYIMYYVGCGYDVRWVRDVKVYSIFVFYLLC